jgi:hypothetical protein
LGESLLVSEYKSVKHENSVLRNQVEALKQEVALSLENARVTILVCFFFFECYVILQDLRQFSELLNFRNANICWTLRKFYKKILINSL